MGWFASCWNRVKETISSVVNFVYENLPAIQSVTGVVLAVARNTATSIPRPTIRFFGITFSLGLSTVLECAFDAIFIGIRVAGDYWNKDGRNMFQNVPRSLMN